MKRLVRQMGISWVRVFGSAIRDEEDGELLGKAWIITWRGRIHLIGYEGVPLRMVCVPQDKIRYWRITMGFAKAEVPDFPRIVK